jgi:choline kinase
VSAQVVILAAGRGVRGAQPSAVVDIGDRSVLEWLFAAFGELGDPRLSVVAGYKAERIVERHPGVHTIFNSDWDTTGPLHSLSLAKVEGETWICYADVVFRPAAVRALRAARGDVVLAADTRWRARYEGRSGGFDRAEKLRLADGAVLAIGADVPSSAADAEFAGLLCLRSPAAEAAAEALRAGRFARTAALPQLVTYLLARGLRVNAVDLEGDWAELDAPQDLARFVLGTKAESLARLSRMSHGGEIGELLAFSFAEWSAQRDALVASVLSRLPDRELIVRSSARAEDSWAASGAGRHQTVPNVASTAPAVIAAVDTVFRSYGAPRPEDQVLVQEMLVNVAVSGVVMTRSHSIGAPYYVINFDDRSARTDTVTSGATARTVYLHRGATLRDGLPPALAQVLSTVKRLEHLVGHDSLDVEFAVGRDGRVHILQVRPIAITAKREPIDDDEIAAALQAARSFLSARAAPPPNLLGNATRYSVMTDWNPAEIIGTKPKRLAFSLYRLLITDEVWAEQRAEYGYRDVRPCPLLVDVAGHPYVDVRADFTSFVPEALPDSLAARLVEHALARLAERPELHDKVEFEVVFTCQTTDFDARAAERLAPTGFTTSEIAQLRHALAALTERGIDRTAADAARLPAINAAIDSLLAASLPPLEKAFQLLELARRSGTPVFAHLARSAFVATSLLRSLQAVGAISATEHEAFLSSIHTVLSGMLADAARVRSGALGFETLVATYGHLRPGTYDITSPCYRAAGEQYLRPIVERAALEPPRPDWRWSVAAHASIAAALTGAGLRGDVERFEAFARTAIAGREESKFVFTRALSGALECLAEFGASHGLERAALAYVAIRDLFACREVLSDARGFLARRVLEGREAYQVCQGLCLPGQIANAVDLECFEQVAAEPNFVTQRTVEGGVVAGTVLPGREVSGCIVLIESADPGFDWLLARNLAGLVTMYGGANSHMAVRAAELGLPAAIGVGEHLYAELAQAATIRLDCAARTIRVVH